ncbi:prolyl oligopeptidase family serine peptidase [Pseudobowmanella zhangzhouensis]|uniref:Prolyl oligopeptidase family serine peptidase n=1 Tax=Pseudobowmanella zhangzhouensis TaxID=1537679 RepID=A0ABW1XMB6_9ALTE
MHKYTKSLLVSVICTSLLACNATSVSTAGQTPVNTPVVAQTLQTPVQNPLATGTITLEQIMADPDWLGRQPENAYWSSDSQHVLFERKREGAKLNDLYIRALSDNDNGQLVPLDKMHTAVKSRVTSVDGQYQAWQFEGNLFLLDKRSGSLRQLSRGTLEIAKLQFLNDGRLAFQQGDALVAMDIQSGVTSQLLSWSFADKPEAVDAPKDYIAEQQLRLIRVMAERRAAKQAKFDAQQALQRANPTMTPEPVYLKKGHELVTVSLSPNAKFAIIATQEPQSWREDGDIMPNYIKEDGRIKAEKVRARVADAKPVNQDLWLVNIQEGSVRPLSYTSLPGYNEDVLAAVKTENAKAKGETYTPNRLPRAIGLMEDWYWDGSAIQWQQQGDNVAIMLEAWDNKDRWLVTVDLANAGLKTQERLHDDAWVNYRYNSFGWLNNSATLFYLSEKSGYSHLYLQKPGQKAEALTRGAFEVDNLTLTQDDGYIYFQANRPHPGIYEIYRVNLQSKEIEQLTQLNGMTDYRLSPDEQKLLLTHSKTTLPPELYVQEVVPNSEVTRLTHTVSEAFLAMPWTAPEIVPVPSSHGSAPIYSRVYLPADYQQGQARKAVVFSHGAGYLQNSHLGWSGYFREFMFHSMLVQQGYVVMDMDYRASEGYGRDWRTAIYRHMGKPEIEDLRDGVNWLVKNANVDRQRIGTYGGSYGGFMTFMALFTAPDLFQVGAALRPVSDWAHYNTGYTANILNTPDVDPIAYERSSPIYFAEGLQKPLLINSPMVDNNVFFQDSVRLVQRLIELEKKDFETAIFPVESHGFVEPSSWLDEYRRIYKLFEQNL